MTLTLAKNEEHTEHDEHQEHQEHASETATTESAPIAPDAPDTPDTPNAPPAISTPAIAAMPAGIDIAELFRLQDRINAAVNKELAAHENYKAAKKNRETAQIELSEYIEEMRAPTLFNQSGTATSAATTKAPPPWRETTLDELGIPETTAEKMHDHNPPIRTLGEIADFTASGGQLTDIKGIGESKAAKIEDACNDFWKTYDGPREDAESTGSDDDDEDESGEEDESGDEDSNEDSDDGDEDESSEMP